VSEAMSTINCEKIKVKLLSKRGFSLIEVVIAMSMSLFILSAAYAILIKDMKTYSAQDNIVRMQQDGRFAMALISKKIRMAGFDPMKTQNFGITGSNYSFTNNSAIISSNNSLFFTFDENKNGIIDSNPTEKIGYRISDTDGDGLSDSLQIDSITGGWKTLKGNVIGFDVVYTYSNGDLSTGPAGLPDNSDGDSNNDLRNVRLIEVTLTSRTSKEDRSYSGGFNLKGTATDGTCRTYSLRSRIRPRNIGL